MPFVTRTSHAVETLNVYFYSVIRSRILILFNIKRIIYKKKEKITRVYILTRHAI